MSDGSELRRLESLLAALVAAGNTLLDGGFVRRYYDPDTDTVHCRHCWGSVTGGSA